MKIQVNMMVAITVIVVLSIFALLINLPAQHDAGTSEYPNVRSIEDTPDEISPKNKSPEYVMSIATDKSSYHEKELMNVTMMIRVPEGIDGADLRFFGVTNKYGADKIKKEIEVNLVEGENEIISSARLPSCYGCSGIDPGTFELHCALYDNDTQIINATTEIEILE